MALISLGLITTVQPAASAGAILIWIEPALEFQGVRIPTTLNGSIDFVIRLKASNPKTRRGGGLRIICKKIWETDWLRIYLQPKGCGCTPNHTGLSNKIQNNF
jgi:hypothetical protein